jgi:drug/metabolite transporter (DMT)-like permease
VNQNTKFLPFAALAVGVIAISWSAIFVRWTQMPGIASAFYRLLIASAVIWIILLTRKSSRGLISRNMFLLAILGGMFFAADVGSYNVAVLHTTAGGATFLGNNAPIIVGLVTWLLTIVYVDHAHLPMRIYGDLLATFASVCFAFYLLVTERLREQMSTLTLVGLSTTASTVALFLFAISTSTPLSVPSGSSLAALAGLGLLCQFTGYLCLTYALGHLPATISSVVLLAVSPLTAVWALFCFGERMTVLQWCGGGLILAAVWIVSKATNKAEALPVSTEAVQMEV